MRERKRCAGGSTAPHGIDARLWPDAEVILIEQCVL